MGIPDTIEATSQTDTLDRLAQGLNGFGHPVRVRALVLLEFEHSPSMLTEALGDTPLGVVAYHVRMLRDYGLAEEVRTEPKRGALEHFYHRTELADDLLAVLAKMLGVPKRRAGRAGTPARLKELQRWVHRKAEPEPAE
jgi:hypothetical protein